MSYQVLARKWRPRIFSELVGQEHVVRALTNALDNDRLHHAYLFTGTRGVGKTTLARIFAKSLNCTEGVGSHPCGVCSVCKEIDEGRFADLLEVDAASRTKVDQTRELLENVPYAPVHGRYKVYLIDEVHMFSSGSFNALLKTLEEPPPHVKFLLATTDPQKVPVTVLSRCLQFNLKRLPLEQIRGYLEHVLGEEAIPFEVAGLQLLARAADGSMRDALSLLDQAIAFGAGEVKEADVRAMLGAMDGEQLFRLLDALADGDAALTMQRVAELAERAPDFAGALQELLYLLHRVALYQAVPETLDRGVGDEDWVASLAGKLAPEDAQLYYQIGMIGRRDLPLAPDPRSGFEMVMLRMLTFRPASLEGGGGGAPVAARPPASRPAPSQARPPEARRAESPPPGSGQPEQAVAAARQVLQSATASPQPAPRADTPPPEERPSPAPAPNAVAEPAAAAPQPESPAPAAPGCASPPADAGEWRELIGGLRLGGVTRQLANNCIFEGLDGERIRLKIDPAHANINTDTTRERLEQALAARFGDQIRLDLSVADGDAQAQTPAQLEAIDRSRMQERAERAMAEDPLVKAFESEFDARLVEGSIRPRDGLQ